MNTKKEMCDEGCQESHERPSNASETLRYNQCYHDPNCKSHCIYEQFYHNYFNIIQRTYDEYYRNYHHYPSFNHGPSRTTSTGSLGVHSNDLRKYPMQHAFVSFSNGLLVCVKAKYSFNRFPNIVKVMKFKLRDSTYKLLKRYPGPLTDPSIRREVIAFCENELVGNSLSRRESPNEVHFCRASNSLLWSLLAFLLKQPGRISQKEIANIILVNKSNFPYVKPQPNSIELNLCFSKRTYSSSSIESEEKVLDEGRNSGPLLVAEHTFEKYLAFGDIDSAMQWSVQNKLWGNAFFLESIGLGSKCNVAEMFGNSLPYDSPTKTLYEILKDKSPSILEVIRNGLTVDWRPHAAAILSNMHLKPNQFGRALIELGNVLRDSGDPVGFVFNYFSYLICFQEHPNENLVSSSEGVQLVLLDSIQSFSNDSQTLAELIIATEIFEYALNIVSSEVQYLKYFLALRMIDSGLEDKAANYLCSIFHCLKEELTNSHRSLLQQVYALASKLKNLIYLDLQLQNSFDWLIELKDFLRIETNQDKFPNFREGVLVSSSPHSIKEDPAPLFHQLPENIYAIKIEDEHKNEPYDRNLNTEIGFRTEPLNECPLGLLRQVEQPSSHSINPGNENITNVNGKTPHENSKNWLSAVLNKITLKPKNQMHLPDDNNPTIVWDADQGRWINVESNEVLANFVPPPKCCDTTLKTSLKAMEGSNSAGNAYRMQKNRPLKCSYVNVLASNDFRQ